MIEPISLRKVEQKVFRSTFQDGLWDVLLGSFLLMFVIAPLLSQRLGDFWSSAIFLPFWGLVYLAVVRIRQTVIVPRVGVARFGRARTTRLTRFAAVMLVLNVVGLVLGIVAATGSRLPSGWTVPAQFGLVCLVGFSLAAFFLDFARLYLYGFLIALSPVVGEWLWLNGWATHHGFPATFGFTAAVLILTGIVLFLRLLRRYPLPVEESSSEDPES